MEVGKKQGEGEDVGEGETRPLKSMWQFTPGSMRQHCINHSRWDCSDRKSVDFQNNIQCAIFCSSMC